MPKFLSSDAVLLAYSRVWFAGLCPVAPGTCGSLAAILLAPFLFMPLSFGARIILLIFVLVSGGIAGSRAEQLLGKEDPPEVVIDEVLGQWITCLPFVGLAWWEYALAFALFRLFDISKPWPVRALEKIGGGPGIMLDDAAAGIYAMLCLALIRLAVQSLT